MQYHGLDATARPLGSAVAPTPSTLAHQPCQVELASELIRARGTSFDPFIPQLRQQGLSDRIIKMCGVAFVRRRSDKLYEPDEDGSPELLVPVEERGELIDLLVLLGERRWLLRTGAGVLLGFDNIDWQLTMPAAPAPIWRSPLGWLRSGGEGVCIVGSWEVARQQLGWLGGPFLAENVAHAPRSISA